MDFYLYLFIECELLSYSGESFVGCIYLIGGTSKPFAERGALEIMSSLKELFDLDQLRLRGCICCFGNHVASPFLLLLSS
jgi:hypothetical protein